MRQKHPTPKKAKALFETLPHGFLKKLPLQTPAFLTDLVAAAMKPVSFFKSLARLLFLNALIKPLWIFGVDRQVQNLVGASAYGTYFSLFNLSLVFAFLTDAGISNMANQRLATGNAHNIKQLLRLKGVLAGLYAGFVFAAAWLAGVRQWHLLLPIVLLQVLLSFFNFFRSVITAHQFFNWDAWLSVLDKLLLLLFFLPLLYTQLFQKPISILLFVQAQLATLSIATAVTFFTVWQKNLLTSAGKLPLRRILKHSAPYALIILLMATHNRLDGFLLARLHPAGAYQAGVYAAAYRLLDAANNMGFLVAAFLVPFIARHRGDKPLLNQTIAAARFVLLLAACYMALAALFFSEPLQKLLYPAFTTYTAQVIHWCLPVLPAYFLLHVYGSVLTGMGQLKSFIVILLAAVLLNTALNVWLIPALGALGACYAALATQYLCAVAAAAAAIYKNHLQTGWRSLSLIAFAGVGIAVVFYTARMGGWQLVPALLVGGVVVLLALFAYLSQTKYSFKFLR